MLSDDANQGSKPRKEVIQILIGKAWVKADKSFKIAPITIPDPDNEGQYIVAPVYPLLATDYTGFFLGVNKKCDATKNQNSHWVFLQIDKDRVDEYKALLGKIGQEIDTTKPKA